jgi:rare lipoprotein A
VLAVLCGLLPAACTQPAPVPAPHYVLGPPYQSGGVWYYPGEEYETVLTGLATVYAGAHPPLTADGERFDQSALTIAHPTLQLPAIGRLTNLENGRQTLVRINDRGPGTPHRLIAVTRRTAELLDFPTDRVARVRLEVLPGESHAATETLPGAPSLTIAAAPRGRVQESPLPDLTGARSEHQAPPAATEPTSDSAPTSSPMRMPETVSQTSPAPGGLWIQLGSFHSYRYAALQRARLPGLHAEILAAEQGGQQEYRVRLGPFATVSQADAALDQAIRAGVTDARIVIESDAA